MQYYFEDLHRDFVPHVLAFIENVALSTPDCEESVTSKLKDILRYSDHLLRFWAKFKKKCNYGGVY